MNALEAATADIINKIVSHISATGYFAKVNAHEPKSQPHAPLTAAVFVQQLTPVQAASGLATTSFRLEIGVRLYQAFKTQPEDLIDVHLGKATAAVIGAFSGDFDLGSTVRDVDLLGAHGTALGGRAGYQTLGGQGSGVTYRIMDITVPVIISDGVDQGA